MIEVASSLALQLEKVVQSLLQSCSRGGFCVKVQTLQIEVQVYWFGHMLFVSTVVVTVLSLHHIFISTSFSNIQSVKV